MKNTDTASDFDVGKPASDHPPPMAYSTEPAALGIARSLIEVFAVGPYKYTNLEDAISQAKRGGVAG